MSTLHQDRGRADADTGKGELRKPQDYSNQPGQSGPGERDADAGEPADRDVAGPANTGVAAPGSGGRGASPGGDH